ncbi:flagellar hook-basal body protein [Microvirga lotononidis]|uniref:Flagellar hook protein FlgE n=2 Tax=Microvirga lotononidis TaxID=864069 RepID=I4YR97_9HYPH|nr:flagellar hook protein FlgE [Microvirga lotononidis]EIM26489.1 flagellar hook-basal body protein [Microvirga lotononidis]
MGIYGAMRTSLSGMNAQSSRLSTISDNIANQNTTGYKRASTEFATFVATSGHGSYDSGSVTSSVRYSISQQGAKQYTTSAFDLMIDGNGFFPVVDAGGAVAYTRAGSFVPIVRLVETEDGTKQAVTRLINPAGFELLGQKLNADGTSSGAGALVPIELPSGELKPNVSRSGVFKANLPASTSVRSPWTPPAGTLPAEGTYDIKTSIVTYDPLGTKVTLDVYLAKTGANEWQVAVYDRGSESRPASLRGTSTLAFDPMTGKGSGGSLSFDIPHATETGATFPFTLDLTGMQQVDAPYTVYKAEADGNAASSLEGFEISTDGTLYEVYADGTRNPSYQIQLASFQSPDRLSTEPGNVYRETQQSGGVKFGTAGSAGYGSVNSGTLEASNVDLGTELAEMIQSQSAYTANSKVFQTGSELLDVLINLKR